MGVLNSSTGIAARRELVPTAGTAHQLSSVYVPFDMEAVIMALSTNTGTIYVGGSKIDAEDTSKSFPLAASDSISYKVKNLDCIWINATVGGEGVIWTVEQGARD